MQVTVKDPAKEIIIENENQLAAFNRTFAPSHKVFADKFLETFDTELAYKTAYNNLQPRDLSGSIYQIMSRPDVRAYLTYRYRLRQQKAEVTVNQLIKDLIDVRDRSFKQSRNNDKLSNHDKRAYDNLALKAIEMIANMLGITKTVAQNISFNQINNFNQNVIVKTFVVPAFKSTVTPPEINADNTKALIEEYIKERKD